MIRTMKLDKADIIFSQYIRLRDGKCMRCQSYLEVNGKGMPINLQCSHYFGRRMESVRFDEENADALCHGCHRYWEKEDREAYRSFKIKQLGEDAFDALVLRANTPQKKDRALAYLYWKGRLDQSGLVI